MSELKEVFLAEAEKLLAEIEPLILNLEKGVSPLLLDELFRVVHTLKGSAGIAGIRRIGTLAHHLEDLLDRLRGGEIEAGPGLVDLLLAGFDGLRDLVDGLAAGRELSPSESLLREIAAYARGEAPAGRAAGGGSNPAKTARTNGPDGDQQTAEKALPDEFRRVLLDGLQRGRQVYHLTLAFGRDFFCQGHNLGYLLEDLTGLGDIAGLRVDGGRVPPLSRLDPENYHLVFTLYLVTDADRETVEDTFVFVVSEENRVVVRPITGDELRGAPRVQDPESAAGASRPDGALLPAQKRPYVIGVLRQQEKALRLAADEVLPGLLPVVRRILERLAAQMGEAREEAPAAGTEEEKARLLRMAGRLLAALNSEAADAPEKSLTAPDPAGGGGRPGRAEGDGAVRGRRQHSFRVQQETADALMRLSGELIVAKNSLPYLVRELESLGLEHKARELKERCLYLDRISREMHERVMDIWLLPVQEVFGRFPRFVREETRRLNKKVEVVTAGGDTRLDRNIIEEIYEPLLHLVRNALDHGIEEVEARQRAGKDPVGTIRLEAWRQGERVFIRVADDGRGIDGDALAAKAVSGGLISREEAAGMTDREKLRLAFRPGLSSKEEVSDLSGRGVGMDAVENTVKRLGGTVEVESASGAGAAVVIGLPFSMATSEVLLVRIGEEVYGLPLAAVRETVRVEGKDLRTLRGRPVVRRRGQIIPVLPVQRCLEAGVFRREEAVLVVLWQQAALPVDDVLGREEIIVKPLTGELRKLRIFTGAAVLGDGRVLLVLDPNELVHLCRGEAEEGGRRGAAGD